MCVVQGQPPLPGPLSQTLDPFTLSLSLTFFFIYSSFHYLALHSPRAPLFSLSHHALPLLFCTSSILPTGSLFFPPLRPFSLPLGLYIFSLFLPTLSLCLHPSPPPPPSASYLTPTVFLSIPLSVIPSPRSFLSSGTFFILPLPSSSPLVTSLLSPFLYVRSFPFP